MNKIYVVFIAIIMGLLAIIGVFGYVAIKNIKNNNNTITGLTNFNAALRADIERYIKLVGELNEQVIALENTNSGLQETNNELGRIIKELRAGLDELKRKLNEARDTASGLANELTNITDKFRRVREIVDSIGNSGGSAEELINEIIAGFEQLKNAIIGQGS